MISWFKVAVVGSREGWEYGHIARRLEVGMLDYPASVCQFISGGAIGVDSFAKQWADLNGYTCEEIIPNWYPNGVYDKSAGMKRNKPIIEAAGLVIAFEAGTGRGTGGSIAIAKRLGTPLVIYTPDGGRQDFNDPVWS